MNTRDLILSSGLRQAAISRALGVSRAAVCAWAGGGKAPALPHACKLAQITNHVVYIRHGKIRYKPAKGRARRSK